ncbi:hypothetical protein V7S43_004833 [Phytophthora oleae]|uniref:Uncharacterized protein n=1 Tax=Phytophthora oleae TaxID=2107226 RepID=A0ABD3FWB0_9STRA
MAPKDAVDVYEGINVSISQQSPKSSTHSEATTTGSSSTVEPTSPALPEQRRKRQRSPSISACETSPQKMKKRLRWSTITIHEFGVGLGGSSVPGKGGPSIGLSDKPEFTWTTNVGEMAECVEGVHRFSSDERVQLLQNAGVCEGMILRFSREANIINCSRRRTLVEVSAERKEAKKQRQQQQLCKVESPRPCSSSFLNRPRMIPVNYV